MNDPKTTDWREAASLIVKQVAQNNQYVVSDMVVTALEKAGLGLENYSSLGGVFKRAAATGYIKKTADKIQSTRSKSHSAKTVWVSLIHQPKDVSPEARALNQLLTAALQFNTSIVAIATQANVVGPMKQSSQKQLHKTFMKMQDEYQASVAQIAQAYEEAMNHAKN